MTKKPNLLVAGSLPVPPRPLGEAGEELWLRVQTAYDITDVGGIELLLLACESTDRAAELRVQIDMDGPVLRTKTGVKAHPALRDELACRAFTARTIQRLGLDVEPVKAMGRPSGIASGWTG